MMKKSTAIPNVVFDEYISSLKPSEVCVLLVIYRQTVGWIDQYGNRKQRDWITNAQFQKRTGLSDKTVTGAIDTLVQRRLIKVTDALGNMLLHPEDRRGKVRIFYAPLSPHTVNFPVV